MMTLKNSMIGTLLVIAACLSTWTILITKDPRAAHTSIDKSLPDAFMENVVATIMNKQGTPSLKISTPRMVHYANNDTTDFDKPIVTIYRQSPNPWLINSDYAKATQGIDQILFWSNVVIHHNADNENPTTTMQTSTLTIFPEKQTAETNKAVVIKQPDTTIHAIGMMANMNDGTVKLLSQAQGEYAPSTT